jgi:hypothetical protein
METSLETLHGRTGASSSAILLGTYMLVLGFAIGETRVAVKSELCNRFTEVDQNHVGSLVQPALVSFDLGSCRLYGDAVKMAARASLMAYMHGRYNASELAEAIRRAEQVRHGCMRLPFYFNDLREIAMDDMPRPSNQSNTFPDGKIEKYGPQRASGNSDLYLWVSSSKQGIKLKLRSRDSRFSPELTRVMLAAIDDFLRVAAANEHVSLDQLRGRMLSLS